MSNSIAEPLDKQVKIIFNQKTNKEEQFAAIVRFLQSILSAQLCWQMLKSKKTKKPKDRIFKQEYDFMVFKALPSCFYNGQLDPALSDEYEERLGMIVKDLRWLLALPYQKFWCQMIYDPNCSRLIDSYLRYAPRFIFSLCFS